MATDGEDDARYQLPQDRRPLQEMIEDKLRDLIDGGELRPGDKLPNEAVLAAQMSVARGSLRSALQRLEGQRIIEVKRGLGWFVRRPPVIEGDVLQEWLTEMNPEIRDVLELRQAIETTATSLAARRATKEDLSELEALNERHRRAGDIDELVRTDDEFHRGLVRASRNNLLIAMHEMMLPELAVARAKIFSDDAASPARSANSHDGILQFLQNGDAVGSRVAITNHMLELYNHFSDTPTQLTAFAGRKVDGPLE